jgi:cytochrome c553
MKCLTLVMIFLMPMTIILSGCRRDMFNQPKSNPLRESDFFPDGAASRLIPPHTVARGDLENDDAFFTGMIGTNLVTTFPFPITREVLERGRQRFEINCVPCHGETGEGNGVVVARGFPRPPSYHLDRLRMAPIGHFFDVMTRGYGVMFAQAERVTPEDRWAIAAYIRALQLSENATAADVPASEMAKLQTAP